MVEITVTYGAQCLDDVDGMTDALAGKALDAADEAMREIARRLGHQIEITRYRGSYSGVSVDVECSSYRHERKHEDRYRDAWVEATDAVIAEG